MKKIFYFTFLFFLPALPVLAHGEDDGFAHNDMMGRMMSGNGWYSMSGWDWVIMILFWVIIIIGIITLLRWLVNQSGSKTKGKSALDIQKSATPKVKLIRNNLKKRKKL